MAIDIRFVGFDNICVRKLFVSEPDEPHASNNIYAQKSQLRRETTVPQKKN